MSEQVNVRSLVGSAPIVVGDNDALPVDTVVLAQHLRPYMESVLIPKGLVQDRVEKMALDIRRHYKTGELHLICLLKGSRRFFSSLLAALNNQEAVDSQNQGIEFFEHYLRAASYCNDASTGQVNITKEDMSYLKGKRVLIVEDLIDTGLTLEKVKNWLLSWEPESIAIASLLQKRVQGCVLNAEFLGFSVPNQWIIGGGTDYNERFRGLPHFCLLNDLGKQKFAQ